MPKKSLIQKQTTKERLQRRYDEVFLSNPDLDTAHKVLTFIEVVDNDLKVRQMYRILFGEYTDQKKTNQLTIDFGGL